MERDAGEIFNSKISTLAPEEWLTESAIVELEVLSEHAKNFFVLLITHYILETLRSNPNNGVDSKGNRPTVRHVLFIEEAHNIIASSIQQGNMDSVDPKISATKYIVKMLAEVRALREAIVIADQIPTLLTSEVIKNTGFKLVHRLTAQDEKEYIGSTILASPLQLEQLSSYTNGKALIYYEGIQKPFSIQMAEWTHPNVDYDISIDSQLYENISEQVSIKRTIVSAFQDWQERYLFPTDERIKTLQKRYLALEIYDIAEIYACKCEQKLILKDCELLKKKCKRMEKLWITGGMDNKSMKEEFIDVYKYIENMVLQVSEIRFL